jgi:copper(I)-binding protein
VLRSFVVTAALAIVAAGCQPIEPLAVSGAEFRPPLGSSDVGVGYVTLTSAKADRIVAVMSSKADSVEIHASVTEAGRASMQRLKNLSIRPATRVS